MKKLFFILGLALVAVACSDDADEPAQPQFYFDSEGGCHMYGE